MVSISSLKPSNKETFPCRITGPRPNDHLACRFVVNVTIQVQSCATRFHCFCTDKEVDNGDREEPRRQGHDLAVASGESGKDGVLGSVRLRAGPSRPDSVVEMSYNWWRHHITIFGSFQSVCCPYLYLYTSS